MAVGDALETTLEFCVPGTFTPIDSIEGGGRFALRRDTDTVVSGMRYIFLVR